MPLLPARFIYITIAQAQAIPHFWKYVHMIICSAWACTPAYIPISLSFPNSFSVTSPGAACGGFGCSDIDGRLIDKGGCGGIVESRSRYIAQGG